MLNERLELPMFVATALLIGWYYDVQFTKCRLLTYSSIKHTLSQAQKTHAHIDIASKVTIVHSNVNARLILFFIVNEIISRQGLITSNSVHIQERNNAFGY